MPDGFGRPALVAHVDLRRGILADQDDGEARRVAAARATRASTAVADFAGQLVGDGFAIEDAGGHRDGSSEAACDRGPA